MSNSMPALPDGWDTCEPCEGSGIFRLYTGEDNGDCPTCAGTGLTAAAVVHRLDAAIAPTRKTRDGALTESETRRIRAAITRSNSTPDHILAIINGLLLARRSEDT